MEVMRSDLVLELTIDITMLSPGAQDEVIINGILLVKISSIVINSYEIRGCFKQTDVRILTRLEGKSAPIDRGGRTRQNHNGNADFAPRR